MKRERLLELFSRYKELTITVVGDLFLDRWYEIDESLNEPSVETGLTAYQIVRKRSAAGAAGTVLNNLSEMGVGKLRVVSMVGEDGDGWEMLQRLKERRVNTDNVVISPEIYTPAYIKPQFPEEGNRFDIKNFTPTPQSIQQKLMDNAIKAIPDSDAVLLLDQVCEANVGVLTEQVRNALCRYGAQHPEARIFADSRAYIDRYRDVIIKCNNYEAAHMTGRPEKEGLSQSFDPKQVFACMKDLEKLTHRPAVITCNAHGVAVSENGCEKIVPAVRHNCPIDICGAGDACSAGLVSALCAGASYEEAAFIGNLSSGVTVRQIGRTGTASQEAMIALYDEQWPLGMEN